MYKRQGYSVDTGRNVYLQPSLASQGVKGTVTNALASAFVGSLGGGKSFCNNLLVYYSVLFGGQAVILDPKAEKMCIRDRNGDLADLGTVMGNVYHTKEEMIDCVNAFYEGMVQRLSLIHI